MRYFLSLITISNKVRNCDFFRTVLTIICVLFANNILYASASSSSAFLDGVRKARVVPLRKYYKKGDERLIDNYPYLLFAAWTLFKEVRKEPVFNFVILLEEFEERKRYLNDIADIFHFEYEFLDREDVPKLFAKTANFLSFLKKNKCHFLREIEKIQDKRRDVEREEVSDHGLYKKKFLIHEKVYTSPTQSTVKKKISFFVVVPYVWKDRQELIERFYTDLQKRKEDDCALFREKEYFEVDFKIYKNMRFSLEKMKKDYTKEIKKEEILNRIREITI